MKREDVKNKIPGITEEQLNWIMTDNGTDINREKTAAEQYKNQLASAQAQLKTAQDGLAAFEGKKKPEEYEAELAKLRGDMQAQADGSYAGASSVKQRPAGYDTCGPLFLVGETSQIYLFCFDYFLTTLQLFQSGTTLHTTTQSKQKKQTKIRTIHSKSANCADFLMVAPAGVEPAMEESKSSALPPISSYHRYYFRHFIS